MTLTIIHAQGEIPNPHKLLQTILTADADILPGSANQVLEVRPLGLGAEAQDRHIALQMNEPSATQTICLGANLKMAYRSSATDGDPKCHHRKSDAFRNCEVRE